MKDIRFKILKIFIPFLLINLGTFIFYNLFRWFFDIKLGVLSLKEDLVDFWIPILLPWIPILFFLRKPIQVLNLKKRNESFHFFYKLIISFAIAVPIIISQTYIGKVSFDLIKLDNIQAIDKYKDQKYFELKSFEIDTNLCLPYITSSTSGRYSENFFITLYYSCEFENKENVWYGVSYTKKIDNRISKNK